MTLDYLELFLLGASAFAVAAILTAVLARVAPCLGLVDEPGDAKFHRAPTPLGGGIAMLLALLPVLLVPATHTPRTLVLLGGAAVVAAIGLVDDRRGVPAPVKLLALLALTTLLWWLGLGATTTRIPWLDYAITLLWMSGVASAFNAIDNMDGLAAGVAAIAAASFLLIAVQTGQWLLAGLSATLLGATLGFLPFNLPLPRARIFMGDTGSFLLGFLLAALGVLGDWNENELIAAVIPVLILGVPIFDLAFTVIRRHLTGVTRTTLEALRHCDTDHLSHRLVRIGLSPRSALAILYLIAASFGISAVSLREARSGDGLLHLLQAGVIAAALIPVLCLAEGPRPAPVLPPALAASRRLRAWIALLALAGGLLSVLLA